MFNNNLNTNNKNFNPQFNPKEIHNTLNEARNLTKAANTYINSISPINNNNIIDSQKSEEIKDLIYQKTPKNPNKSKEPNKNNSTESSEDEDEKNQPLEDSEDEGIYTIEYLSYHIDRYSKKVEKYDNEVKKNLLLSKKYPSKKDEYKDEAVRALKKKKFYGKCLERNEKRKLKLDLKNLDKEFEIQKKELKKLTHDFKKKVALVTKGEEIDEEREDIGDDVNGILDQVDIDEKILNEEYLKIICRPEVLQINENLNLFKFVFQED